MKEVKLTLMGNYALQFTDRSIRMCARTRKTLVDVRTADYDTVDLEVISQHSPLYRQAPDFIFWHESTLRVREHFYHTEAANRPNFAENYIRRIEGLLSIIAERLPDCRVIFPNHSICMEDHVFGNFGFRLPHSWMFQSTKLNSLLNTLASETDNLYILQSRPSDDFGPTTNHTLSVTVDLPFTLPYLDWLARNVVQMIECQRGRFHKCLIMDLDNTLWGGIIGDDGVEGIQLGDLGAGKAFSRLQKWIRELGQRGIILAICSKNEESIARLPFISHPDMILSLDDISIFVANWESKSDNIARIRDILNIGFDSMVFIDDNPAEREIVRRHLPEVTVPELPEDPALYLPFLSSLNLFETSGYDRNDHERTRQYQEESRRQQVSRQVTNMEEFLNSLEMRGKITSFKEEDVERISQLSLRSNQFNLRTIRYQPPEIRRLMLDSTVETFSAVLSDKFGHYGLISIVIVRILPGGDAHIDTWLMSCRVLKRTVEVWLMNNIMQRLAAVGVKRLHGEYLPTPKNGIISDLLPKLGFGKVTENNYEVDLTCYSELPSNILEYEHHHQ